MKSLQIPQKLVHEKFYIHEIAAVNLSKICFLKNVKKTCEPNKRGLNRDWMIPQNELNLQLELEKKTDNLTASDKHRKGRILAQKK